VAVLEEGEGVVGFFPFQRGRLGTGRPVGGILSDYHGLIAAPELELDARALLRESGLATWEFNHLLASQRALAPYHLDGRESLQIELPGGGYEEYREGLRPSHGSTLSRLGSKLRKLEREHGAITFQLHDDDRDTFERLLRWKSAHYRATGALDILEQPWIREVLRQAHQARDPRFAGVLSTLSAGETPVALHLGLRSGGTLHSWFPVYDPAFSRYSPGLALLLEMIEASPAAGIRLIDLGAGEYRYKRMLANRSAALAAGVLLRPSPVAAAIRARRALRLAIKRSGAAPAARRIARQLRGGE
jgi:CelD/BcsL family acetyltransferase involved in cellulose biosynthesis